MAKKPDKFNPEMSNFSKKKPMAQHVNRAPKADKKSSGVKLVSRRYPNGYEE